MTTMNDELHLTLACFAGLLLGAVYFGGLWWTVRKCLTTPHPSLWLLGSALIRMSVTLTGFYFVSDGQWQRLLACLAGFIAARLIVTWLTRSPIAESNCAKQEARHAS
jgi:F1F0 ATPase subunit 2